MEVFDELPIYENDAVVNHKTIFKVFGMSTADISRTDDLDKVQKIWLYLKPVDILEVDEDGNAIPLEPITSTQVADYINDNSVLDEEIEIEVLYTQVVASQNVRYYNFGTTEEPATISPEQIIAMIEGGYESTYPVPIIENESKFVNGETVQVPHESFSKFLAFDTKTSAVTFASLMDTNDDLFESSTVIESQSVTPAYSTRYNGEYISSYTVTATARYKFKRIADAHGTTGLIDYIAEKANTETRLRGMSMYAQLGDMVRSIRPLADGNLFKTITIVEEDDGTGTGMGSTTTTEYVRVGTDAVPEILVDNPDFDPELPETEYKLVGQPLLEGDNPARLIQQERVPGTGMRGLKKSEFNNLFARMVDNDYTLKPVKKKWYSGLLTIIVIIVVVVIALKSGGTASKEAFAAGKALLGYALYMSAFSLVIAVGVLATSLVSKALYDAGHYGVAIAFRNSVVTLSTLSTISGYISIALGIGTIIESLKQGAKEATKEIVYNEAMEEVTREATTMEVMKYAMEQAVDYVVETVKAVFTEPMSLFSDKSLSQVFNETIKTLNTAFTVYTKIFPPGNVDPGTQVDENTVQPTRTDSAELIAKYVEGDQMYDLNLLMDNMPYNMTEGTIDRAFDKYYSNSRPV